MARTVLPLAGALVGSFFGAPQLGFAIGSIVGNAVDPQRIKGPRIGDANVQTSQEGTPRPIVYGTAAVMGNLIDRGELVKVITEERQGKGGGPIVENESLFMTFAIRICEGPISGIRRIWEDERLVYDIRAGSEIPEDSTKYAEGFALYLGDEEQLPDPDLEIIHGIGNTPAHRGSAYIVFKQKDLTERRGSIPQFRFEVGPAEVQFDTYYTDPVVPLTPPSWLQIIYNTFNEEVNKELPRSDLPSRFIPAGRSGLVVVMQPNQPLSQPNVYNYRIFVGGAQVVPTIPIAPGEKASVLIPISGGEEFYVIVDAPVSVFDRVTFEAYAVSASDRTVEQAAAELGATIVPADGVVRLGDVVRDVSDRCEIDAAQVDATQLDDSLVTGLILSGLYNGGDAVDALRRVYFFDPVEQDGQVVFVDRGGESVVTITEDDLVAAPEQQKRGQALEFPRKMHLDYQNAEIGYAPAKATAARSSSDVRVVGEVSLEAPVVLTSDQAAQTADKILKVTWAEADGEIKFSLGEDFLRLVPTDIITLNLRGTSRRVRITQVERQSGVMNITGYIDRQSAYESNVTGPILRAPTVPPSSFAGPATLAAMDIPALIDTQDQLGMYFAVTGDTTAFSGAQIQISTDGGATFSALTDIRRFCRVGTLLDDVTPALVGPLDTTNVIRVNFGQFAPDLPSFSDAEFLSERGGIAIVRPDGSAEIMQYRDAVEVSGGSSSSSEAGTWELSPLIRGRLNSGATAHSAGALVAYLEDAAFVQLGSALLGQDLTFRAVSFGTSPEDADEQTLTFVGRSQIEMPVLNLVLDAESSGDITADWVRRDRFGTDTAPIVSTNWQGYRVTFTGSTSAVFDTMNPTYTYDASALGGSEITVSVSQLNRITGAGPATSEVI